MITERMKQDLCKIQRLERHGMSTMTNRTFPLRRMKQLESLGLVESAGIAVLCDGDGFTIQPERWGESWRLTQSGRDAIQSDGSGVWQDTKEKFNARVQFAQLQRTPVSTMEELEVLAEKVGAAYQSLRDNDAIDPESDFRIGQAIPTDGVVVEGYWSGRERGLPAVTALCKRNGDEWQTPEGDKMIAPDTWTFLP